MCIVRCTYNNYDSISGDYKPYRSNGITFASRKGAEEYIEYLEQRCDVSDIEFIEEAK